MTDQISAVMAQIIRSTFVACVDTRADVRQAVEISDALLAAPVLAVAFAGLDSADAIAAVRRRHGSNLVAGAWDVADGDAAERLIAAGASFVISPTCDGEVLQLCARHDVLAIPTVISAADLRFALRFHAPICRVPVQEIIAGDVFAGTADRDRPQLLAAGWTTDDDLAIAARAGAALAEMTAALQPQADVIRRVRRLRQIWDDARLTSLECSR